MARTIDGSVTLSFPSRFFPIAGLLSFLITLTLCLSLNWYYGHDIGGIWWPYISDTGKYPPEAAIFGFGMTITSVWIFAVVVLNYGKVKREVEKNACKLSKEKQLLEVLLFRNQSALFLGMISTPFLGLLAVFDTDRSPELHMLFVLIFFPFVLAYCFVNTSVYHIFSEYKIQQLSLKKLQKKSSNPKDETRTKQQQQQQLQPQRDDDEKEQKIINAKKETLLRSVFAKKIFCCGLLIFSTLYLPVGMYFVSDWYNYRNDVAIHTFRAITQHLAVLNLVLYFGSFWFDFGVLRMLVLQSGKDDDF